MVETFLNIKYDIYMNWLILVFYLIVESSVGLAVYTVRFKSFRTDFLKIENT
jgi:hypothetical protein